MYREKAFRIRRLDEVERDLEIAASYYGKRGETVRKLFLCDGDALSAPSDIILSVLERANALFPGLRRIGVYATARNVLEKSDEELRLLRKQKLSIAYIGLESGSDEVLGSVRKGNTGREVIEAVGRLRQCDWQTSLIVMLGLGGRALSKRHREQTVEAVSQASPRFLSFLTTVAVPGTPYFRKIEKEELEPLTTLELLEEMHYLLKNICSQQSMIFRANHVSNPFPLEGVLPKDRERLLSTLAAWIRECPAGVYPHSDPFIL